MCDAGGSFFLMCRVDNNAAGVELRQNTTQDDFEQPHVGSCSSDVAILQATINQLQQSSLLVVDSPITKEHHHLPPLHVHIFPSRRIEPGTTPSKKYRSNCHNGGGVVQSSRSNGIRGFRCRPWDADAVVGGNRSVEFFCRDVVQHAFEH
jgi:hypothetical protein